MKLVIAYIRPECLGSVKQELFTHALYSMSVTNILGCGRQKGYTETYRGVATEVNLLKKLRVELYIADADVDKAMNAIAHAAKTGKEGDGIIYALDVHKGIRIRTGESF